jgi:hypothetical protein
MNQPDAFAPDVEQVFDGRPVNQADAGQINRHLWVTFSGVSEYLIDRITTIQRQSPYDTYDEAAILSDLCNDPQHRDLYNAQPECQLSIVHP